MKHLQKILMIVLFSISSYVEIAIADLKFPMLVYRTGAYAPYGIPLADGFGDYYKMINARDGGIGGEKIIHPECETGFRTQVGVECYEKNKKDAMVFQPMSTGITFQLIPKATNDGVTIYSTGYGRTSSANGKVFKWIFNAPVTYWDGASIAVRHILKQNLGNIKGKKIALVYHNSYYGKEPIRTLLTLSKKHGYELMLLPVDHPGQEQEQKQTWLKIRNARPDYILMWGWGVMNQVAIKSAASIKFPMDKFIGVWFSGSENDVLPAGQEAHGYKSLTFNAPGDSYQVHKDIKKYVHDKGEASGDGSHFGTVLYNRGLFQAMVQVEAAVVAQKIHGTSKITPAMYRDGMENVKLDAERMEELGFKNFSPPFENSCANHGGSGLAAVQQWNAKTRTWNIITDYMGSDKDIVNKLIAIDSAEYAKEQKIALRSCVGSSYKNVIASKPKTKIYTQIKSKDPSKRPLAYLSDISVCYNATITSGGKKVWNDRNGNFVGEAKYRGLDCGVKIDKTIIASKPKITKQSISSAELEKEKQKRIALQRKANEEERIRKVLEQRIAELEKKNKELQQPKQIKQKSSNEIGSGFYVSNLRHVVTNQHVIEKCKKITVGYNNALQIKADLVASDKRNDLAILQTSSMDMASAEEKSFLQKLKMVMPNIVSKGLMRLEDVSGGEEIFVAGFPFGTSISDEMKLDDGIVRSTKGMDNDVTQFIISSDIQKGNSGGPIYDKTGNIVGMAVSRFVNKNDKINFAIKGSTIKQFLSVNDIPTKWANKKEEMDTKDIYQLASKQTVMVVCYN